MFGKEELEEQLAEEQAKTRVLTQQLETARGHMVTLEGERNRAQAIGHITEVAEAALDQAESSGEVQISAAQTAEEVTRDRYIKGAEAVLADEMITKHGDAIRMEKGPDWDEQVRARLRQEFERNGTFDRVRRDVEADRIKVIADELRDTVRQDEEARLSTDEEHIRLHEKARQQLEDSGEASSIRDKVRQVHESVALEEAKNEVRTEEEAREPEAKAKFKAQWREGYGGRNFIEATRKDLHTKWDSASLDEVQQEVRDEELAELLEAKATRAKAELHLEEFRDKYLKDFSTSGIEMTEIPEGFTITLYLGELESFKVKKTEYGYTSEVESPKKRVATQRMIKLTSLNDGRMVVEYDSLSGSKSVYEKAAAIQAGTVIHIGRKEVDKSNGDEGQGRLQEVVREGTTLYYDDDTRTIAMENSHLMVANVEINGVSALDVAEPRLVA